MGGDWHFWKAVDDVSAEEGRARESQRSAFKKERETVKAFNYWLEEMKG